MIKNSADFKEVYNVLNETFIWSELEIIKEKWKETIYMLSTIGKIIGKIRGKSVHLYSTVTLINEFFLKV